MIKFVVENPVQTDFQGKRFGTMEELLKERIARIESGEQEKIETPLTLEQHVRKFIIEKKEAPTAEQLELPF